MMFSRTKLALTLASGSLAFLFGCGGEEENRLFGSIDQVYELNFSEVKVSHLADFLIIEYLGASSSSQKTAGKVAKLTVNLAGLKITPGAEVDLTEMQEGIPRGVLERIQTATTEFPLDRGTLVVDQELKANEVLKGRFRATLTEPKGRTFNGDFSAKLSEVSLK